jgi:asparagine synthase (glutamine-hydrolysing)
VSGIVALFARGGAPVDVALLERAIAAQRFRGPEGEGSWSRGSVGLGHTLHRTTLEAEREVSPAALDERLFVTADARIDARDELCARLRDHGREPRPDAPDPELILHAYDAWGERCLEHLLGDFVFALWDARRRRLFCAVDAFGSRPFFYADRGGLFVGANNLDCVRLHGGVGAEFDERAVGDFLLFGAQEDRCRTILSDVARIPPGHFVVVTDAGLHLERYFTWPEPVEVPRAPGDVEDEFRELLSRAVRDRLRTPKVAVMMSGGVDSSLVALAAKRELERRFGAPDLRAYTEVYDHLIPDEERHYAGLVARSLSIPIDFQRIDGATLFDWVGRISPPEPPADPVRGPVLDQLARITSHSTVILTGDDGDTLLFAAMRLFWREKAAQAGWAAVARDFIWYLREVRALPPVGLRTYFDRRRRPQIRSRPPWVREDFWRRAELAERWSTHLYAPEPKRSREPSRVFFAGRSWGAHFDIHDSCYLGRPVEFRHPLIDLRLVRFAFGLPAVPWCANKHLLRRCLDGLPEAIRQRPKTPLARDPIFEIIRRGGLAAVRVPAPSPALEPFLDQRALREAIQQARGTLADPWQSLRAVALGLWVEQRRSSTQGAGA